MKKLFFSFYNMSKFTNRSLDFEVFDVLKSLLTSPSINFSR